MQLSTKWARTTADAIRSGVLTEGQIRSIRQRIGNACNFPERKGSCNQDDARELLSLIDEVQPQVTPEQARKGADWLYKACFTSKGTVRRTDFAQEFSEAALQVVRDLKVTPHFTLAELEDIGRGRWSVFVPVYRAHGALGSFTYTAVAWQTGGKSFTGGYA